MKFKIIILISFSTSLHSETDAPFCGGFSARARKQNRFPFMYVNVNIIKKIISWICKEPGGQQASRSWKVACAISFMFF